MLVPYILSVVVPAIVVAIAIAYTLYALHFNLWPFKDLPSEPPEKETSMAYVPTGLKSVLFDERSEHESIVCFSCNKTFYLWLTSHANNFKCPHCDKIMDVPDC